MCRGLLSTRTLYCIISPKHSRPSPKFNKTTTFSWKHCNCIYNQFSLNESGYLILPNLFRKAQFVHYSTSVTPSTGVSLSHVKNVLHLKKLEVKDGFTCLSTKCIFCTNEKTGDLFINKVTGEFKVTLFSLH